MVLIVRTLTMNGNHVRSLSNSSAAALRRKAIRLSGAPESIWAVQDGNESPEEPVVLRSIGCTRHFFTRQPSWDLELISAWEYRLRTLTRNKGINSILISRANENNPNCWPLTLVKRDELPRKDFTVAEELLPSGKLDQVFQASGYDPVQVAQSEDPAAVVDSLGALALAFRGHKSQTRVPTISVWDGLVKDGGAAATACSTYTIATPRAALLCSRPAQGLSPDPVGLTYGGIWTHPAAAWLWACGGMRLDWDDLLHAGLATHGISDSSDLGLLEDNLSQIPPWYQQRIVKEPLRMMGDPVFARDNNQEFRNMSVAETVYCFSDFRGDGAEMWGSDSSLFHGDPSFVYDYNDVPWEESRSSFFMSVADAVYREWDGEESLLGRCEKLLEISSRKSTSVEEREGIRVAQRLVKHIRKQSPLALHATHELLRQGSSVQTESHETCIAREKTVQLSLMGGALDFAQWIRADGDLPVWKHKTISQVTQDEIDALFESANSV